MAARARSVSCAAKGHTIVSNLFLLLVVCPLLGSGVVAAAVLAAFLVASLLRVAAGGRRARLSARATLVAR
jgi:hypothetical protein